MKSSTIGLWRGRPNYNLSARELGRARREARRLVAQLTGTQLEGFHNGMVCFSELFPDYSKPFRGVRFIFADYVTHVMTRPSPGPCMACYARALDRCICGHEVIDP